MRQIDHRVGARVVHGWRVIWGVGWAAGIERRCVESHAGVLRDGAAVEPRAGVGRCGGLELMYLERPLRNP
jgi:hypothetical protein